ncbi:PREDICTED: uncharacterized protein LOC109227253 [Nicotiana attenuata]|uniref:START domain-containing protein n=1 Tax=Nicotiana attenuata TaxID=49451 RepID=A0A1J6IBZ6_NICAT|nr:PREDICTED: uncharacterized protein LOC109227253 [Nicotiana attenuata]OIT02565.1 hypothetical protein A4A49_11580 [Nicotiana attenuata]
MEVERWVGLVELINKPAIMETFVDILVCIVPIWVAIMIGLMIGWSWRPRWTGLVFLGLRSKLNRFVWTIPPGFGARRLWLAFTALSAFSVGRKLWFNFQGRTRKPSADSGQVLVDEFGSSSAVSGPGPGEGNNDPITRHITGTLENEDIVTEKDLEHFLHLLDGKDGEMAWQTMMDRSTSNFTYQAWRHEPEMGPTIYRTKTVFEDATPELVRDFFWDDEFRPKWDPMLAYFKILQESPDTGSMIIHWIKKFPFFCSDREYIIGRRIWESGKTYYCVTKSVPYPSLQRRDKPRRVDLYFSSWIVKPVESKRRDGQLSACEVMLTHYEDMGIPKDVAKLGVRHGMWGTVKKLHNGFRAYQNARKSEAAVSRCAMMARITTKMSLDEGVDALERVSAEEDRAVEIQGQKGDRGIDWKWVAIGATVAVVCGLRTGMIGKAVLLGAGQRIARRGRNA